jgi:hypothetical protein
MSYSKIDIEKLFSPPLRSEARKGLSKRNRKEIVKSMTEDYGEYTYKILPKMSGLSFYNITRQFYKLLK